MQSYHFAMSVIHIPEEEAVKDPGSLVARASQGDEFVIDGPTSSARLVSNGPPKARTGAEIIAILDGLPDVSGVMDDDFARDVMEFRKRHPESLDATRWD
jgi:hypothetical protein